MKLKLLVTNSLPRPRRNRKKASAADLTLNNITARQSLITDASPSAITWNKSLVTEDFHYLEKSALGKADIVNININLGTDEHKIECDKTLSPSDGSELWEGYSDSCGFSDANFNTVPRARSRIKTNPWLASPKPSPAASCDSSPSMSYTTSPITSAITSPNKFDTTRRKLFDFCDSDDGLLNDSNLCHKRERHDSVDSSPSSESMSCLQRSFTSEASDNSITANERQGSVTPVQYSPWQQVQDADQDVSGAQGELDMSTESWMQFQELDSPVSFQYEEELESQLEEEGLAEILGSQESLWGAGADAEWLCERETPAGAEQEEGCLALSDEGAADSDGTLCLDLQQSSPEVSAAEDGGPDSLAPTCRPLCTASIDHDDLSRSPRSDWTAAVTSQPSGRTVEQIRGSLQEKVLRLRKEKMVVDEKVRMAREEERLRQHEKLKLQRQMTLLRKQLLMRTLQDLRTQLNGQSQRLQRAYDHVMARHWEQSRARQPLFGVGTSCKQQPETAL